MFHVEQHDFRLSIFESRRSISGHMFHVKHLMSIVHLPTSLLPVRLRPVRPGEEIPGIELDDHTYCTPDTQQARNGQPHLQTLHLPGRNVPTPKAFTLETHRLTRAVHPS